MGGGREAVEEKGQAMMDQLNGRAEKIGSECNAVLEDKPLVFWTGSGIL